MMLTKEQILTMLSNLEHSIRNGNRDESVSLASLLLLQIEKSIRYSTGPFTGERTKRLVIAMHVAAVRRECMNRDFGGAIESLTMARKIVKT